MNKIESVKKMGNVKKLLLLTFVSLLLLSCAKDIFVPPPTSLRGFYIGRYFVINNVSGSTITREDVVHWTFTDATHICVFPSLTVRKFCDFSGSYTVESNLSLTIAQVATQICNLDDVPEDVFSIRWVRPDDAADTLYIEQFDIPNDRKKIAVLARQPDATN